MRGWNYSADGGYKDVAYVEGNIEVFTVRTKSHYIYDVEGNLLDLRGFSGDLPDGVEAAPKVQVPGAPWKWLFVHPLLGFFVAVIGGLIVAASSKVGFFEFFLRRNS